jgi:Neocarzinostatin family
VKRSMMICVVALVAVLAACGSSGSDKAADTTVATTASTTPPTETPTLPATTTSTSPPSPYKATATPTEGLTDGQEIDVSVSEFGAGKTLGINECAEVGDADVGAADCALDHIKTIKVAADGTGTSKFNVVIANVGSAKHDCKDPATRCFLSIGELSADPAAQRADDIDLKFAS